ncbi:hypothetical protein SD70_11085 [Gordoniibacillus kamchatkensis]|uniref:Uncharacterized protein n=1 Tax=Gordoniibacillus kamchatkensis TaxID=1590651 RepID=A0ABR5AIA7_9BACL|nr:hypothetical protein SD70_11085 [Paenibacillus sp. VKM B-2647]
MQSNSIPYAVVASLIIGTMLALFISSARRNIAISRIAAKEPPPAAGGAEQADDAVRGENDPVYPFYVDCSRTLERAAPPQARW